ncbi:hypothetical protein EVAR_98564_1 [Eumeta japonica]|uniref:Uncharacterized protein n=1 Tax=Eumeta variegata TaxID=151549 RepID=A0A4C1SKE5_EUMVA|nr:hypothetical protein EVAR_98564_1 [Eumeta japonica]
MLQKQTAILSHATNLPSPSVQTHDGNSNIERHEKTVSRSRGRPTFFRNETKRFRSEVGEEFIFGEIKVKFTSNNLLRRLMPHCAGAGFDSITAHRIIAAIGIFRGVSSSGSVTAP